MSESCKMFVFNIEDNKDWLLIMKSRYTLFVILNICDVYVQSGHPENCFCVLRVRVIRPTSGSFDTHSRRQTIEIITPCRRLRWHNIISLHSKGHTIIIASQWRNGRTHADQMCSEQMTSCCEWCFTERTPRKQSERVLAVASRVQCSVCWFFWCSKQSEPDNGPGNRGLCLMLKRKQIYAAIAAREWGRGSDMSSQIASMSVCRWWLCVCVCACLFV